MRHRKTIKEIYRRLEGREGSKNCDVSSSFHLVSSRRCLTVTGYGGNDHLPSKANEKKVQFMVVLLLGRRQCNKFPDRQDVIILDTKESLIFLQ
jgi:hypothetical protein